MTIFEKNIWRHNACAFQKGGLKPIRARTGMQVGHPMQLGLARVTTRTRTPEHRKEKTHTTPWRYSNNKNKKMTKTTNKNTLLLVNSGMVQAVQVFKQTPCASGFHNALFRSAHPSERRASAKARAPLVTMSRTRAPGRRGYSGLRASTAPSRGPVTGPTASQPRNAEQNGQS